MFHFGQGQRFWWFNSHQVPYIIGKFTEIDYASDAGSYKLVLFYSSFIQF